MCKSFPFGNGTDGKKVTGMTGQELIDWIKRYHAEDAVVEIAFRDDGGMYYGTDKKVSPLIVGENVTLPYIGTKDYKRLIM